VLILSVKNDDGTQYEAWVLNGQEEPLEKKTAARIMSIDDVKFELGSH
jgi:hypothetical protein